MDFVIHVETTNPDFIERIKKACDQVGLDVDNDGKYHDLSLNVFEGDNIRFGTVYEPELDADDTADIVKETR